MKVFLGGTCNESEWRQDLIKHLEIDYFNPVVDDWTEDCMKEELRQRKICDVVLYAITPKMSGVYSIAEVVDDSNKRPETTIFLILEKDGDKKFTKAQMKSLKATARLILNNGGKVFENVIVLAGYLNRLKEGGE